MLKCLSELCVGELFSDSHFDDTPRYVVVSINRKRGYACCKQLKDGIPKFFPYRVIVNVIK